MTRPRRVLAGLLATLAIVSTLVGCSSDSSIGRPEYRRRVARVCADLRREASAMGRPSGTGTAELVRSGRRAIALQRKAFERLQALEVPRADAARVHRWLDAVRAALEAGEASLDAQARGDLTRARAANARGSVSAARAAALARRLGITGCASV